MNKHPLIRKIYLYLFSLVGLVVVVIGAVRLATLGLKIYVFTKADQYYEYPRVAPVALPPVSGKGEPVAAEPAPAAVDEFQKNQLASNREREAAEAIGMILVGAPLYFYHWRVIRKDKENES